MICRNDERSGVETHNASGSAIYLAANRKRRGEAKRDCITLRQLDQCAGHGPISFLIRFGKCSELRRSLRFAHLS